MTCATEHEPPEQPRDDANGRQGPQTADLQGPVGAPGCYFAGFGFAVVLFGFFGTFAFLSVIVASG